MLIAVSSSVSRVVALHPEGVDRNQGFRLCAGVQLDVALHPEGVDRNTGNWEQAWSGVQSPSTRRAWIEIVSRRPYGRRCWIVALHPEGVDRNFVLPY